MQYWLDTDLVKSRMSINDDIDGIDDVLESALGASQLRVQADLESVFDLTYQTDLFYLDSSMFNGIQPNGLFNLKLSTGLVRDDDPNFPLVIEFAPVWNYFTQYPQYVNPVLATDYKVDMSRGVVQVSAGGNRANRWLGETQPGSSAGYKNQYVQVSYQSGFKSQAEVPEWLQEALIAYIPSIMNQSQTTNRSAEAAQIATLAMQHSMGVLAPYLRKKGFMIDPM
jgi:hypothetical protein